jgi:hypothetical protein
VATAIWEATIISGKPLTSAELEEIRQLFIRGLTWDGNLLSRGCFTSLLDRGLVQYEFGFAWLTPEGVAIAMLRFATSAR